MQRPKFWSHFLLFRSKSMSVASFYKKSFFARSFNLELNSLWRRERLYNLYVYRNQLATTSLVQFSLTQAVLVAGRSTENSEYQVSQIDLF